MQIAYHPQGATQRRYALRQWVASAKLNIAAPPGIVIRVKDPRHPYAAGREVVADDRKTVGGQNVSRIITTRRRFTLEFQLVSPDIATLWQGWYDATQGGRLPWVFVEPLTGERIAVTSPVAGLFLRRETYNRYQPATLEATEWL